jgi:hypothetical protein
MEHLTPETLARLVDEAPSETEAEHLAQCARCTAERDAYEEQTTALGSLADLRARGARGTRSRPGSSARDWCAGAPGWT